MANNCIETRALDYAYEKKPILKNLSLAVPAGSIYGFLGPNGAGKTTTIRLLLGLLPSSAGKISILGHDVQKQPLEIYSRTGSLIETPSLYGHLSGWENMELCRRLTGASKDRIETVLNTVGMLEHAHTKTRKYSLGMKQRLGLALALIHRPELLILDEPTNGLDPNGIIEMRKLIMFLNREYGKTIFLSSHMLSEIEHIATHAGVIHQGELKFQGTIQELRQQSHAQLRIETNKPQKAAGLLREKALEVGLVDGHFLEVPVTDQRKIAELNTYLTANGLDIYGLSIKQQNLEDVFLNLTK